MANSESPWWLNKIRNGTSLSEVQKKYGNEHTSQDAVEKYRKDRLQELDCMSDDQLIQALDHLKRVVVSDTNYSLGGQRSWVLWERSTILEIMTDRGLS